MRSLFLALILAAPAAAAPKALILDYELRSPAYSDGLTARLSASGFGVTQRQYCPQLMLRDLRESRVLVLLDPAGPGGSGFAPSLVERQALADFVRAGGVVVIGLPAHPDGFKHLEIWNALLAELKTGLKAIPYFPKGNEYETTMLPYLYFHPATSTAPVVLERGPILEVSAPGYALARAAPDAYAVAHIESTKPDLPKDANGYAVLAAAKSGRGAVLVASVPILNADGWIGGSSLQPMLSDEWLAATTRFLKDAVDGVVALAGGKDAVVASAPEELPEDSPNGCGVLETAPGSPSLKEEDAVAGLRKSRSAARGLYGEWLKRGVRAGWTEADHEPAWLDNIAARSAKAGLNTLWAVGSVETLLPKGAPLARQDGLRKSWEALAQSLDKRGVSWLVGLTYPGIPYRAPGYEHSRGPDGAEREIVSPLDARLWDERLIPELELVARFSREHRAAKGAVLDLEMYGYQPLGYPQSAAFEDAAFRAFQTTGPMPSPDRRYAWLRERGLLEMYFARLERAAELLGKRVRIKTRKIDPDFILAVYLYALSDSWFYRGFARGLSTPEDPVLWMSFQGRTHRELWRFERDGRHLLHAAPLMLGGHALSRYAAAVAAARDKHDGYWVNHLTKLVDKDPDPEDIESPKAGLDDAWKALGDASRSVP